MADALTHPLLGAIRSLHDRIRAAVVDACASQRPDELAVVSEEGADDTIYRVDRVSEHMLIAGLSAIATSEPMCVVAEGLPSGLLVLPHGVREDQCPWRVLVDPIDGTRGLMYQKRPAWILTGVAPNRGADTRLADIELAVQTEIPLVKQYLCDQLWAVRGGGAQAQRVNRLTGETHALELHPSRADTFAHGFASVSRFFPGARDVLAAIDDEVAAAAAGPAVSGKAACFEDQYLSTGGQLYELMAGHDRFIADLRPLLAGVLASRGLPLPLCCHPYDVCTSLIASELGVVITGPTGEPLDGPFDVQSEIAWIGYANEGLRARVEPALRAALRLRGMLPGNADAHD